MSSINHLENLPLVIDYINEQTFTNSIINFCDKENQVSQIADKRTPCEKISKIKKWPKKRIKVCWRGCKEYECRDGWSENLNSPQSLAKTVKEIINTEFSIERTGVEFYGWKSCKTDVDNWNKEDADLQLWLKASDDETEAIPNITGWAGHIGYSNNGKKVHPVSISLATCNGKKWSSKLSFDDNLRLFALHEFSHVVGLSHEDDNFSQIVVGLESEYSNDYEKNSVMSYNTLFGLVEKGLSFTQQKKNRLVGNDINAKITSINEEIEQVQMRIGLSSSDLASINCLYKK